MKRRRFTAADSAEYDHRVSIKTRGKGITMPTALKILLGSVCAFTALLIGQTASAQTARIYVTNSAGDSIHVIDPATRKVVQVIKGVESAHGVTFSPDGARVYI